MRVKAWGVFGWCVVALSMFSGGWGGCSTSASNSKTFFGIPQFEGAVCARARIIDIVPVQVLTERGSREWYAFCIAQILDEYEGDVGDTVTFVAPNVVYYDGPSDSYNFHANSESVWLNVDDHVVAVWKSGMSKIATRVSGVEVRVDFQLITALFLGDEFSTLGARAPVYAQIGLRRGGVLGRGEGHGHGGSVRTALQPIPGKTLEDVEADARHVFGK